MKIFTVTVVVHIILCTFAFADVFYFKNGGKVEGIIEEETEDYITINIGLGTMSVRKNEIAHIEEATFQELERLKKKKLSYKVERGEWAPVGCEDIRVTFLKTKANRSALQEAKEESQDIKEEIQQREKKLLELLDILDKKGQEFKRIDSKKGKKKYDKAMEIVADINSIHATVTKISIKIKNLYEEEKELNAKLAKLASIYRSDFQLYKATVNEKRNDTNRGELTPDELYFFEEMDAKIGEMEKDFRENIASYTLEGGHIIVDALIENSVPARLLVDTGASIVLISTDVAYRLGIKYEDIQPEIEIIVADGRSVKAKPIILKSVKVGDAEVKRVQTAILDKEAIGGVDGLLGMSFLSHFVISVDSAANKLVLEKVL